MKLGLLILACVVSLALTPAVLAEEPMSIAVPPEVEVGSSEPAGGAATLLSNVPAYNWYHGCGPTAAGSVLGYWDLHGFDNLFDASGWDNVKLTSNVQDHISSPAHNAKYDPTPDDPNLPVPTKTSIACWFETSKDPMEFGWSYLSRSDDAFEGYVASRGYTGCDSWYESYGGGVFTWGDLVGEIDAGRPLMFLVDSDGNGGTDHFVPVFGYDDRGTGGKYYACYTTWSESETVVWKEFRGMGAPWGIGYATFVNIPEPATLGVLALGCLAGLVGRRRGRRGA